MKKTQNQIAKKNTETVQTRKSVLFICLFLSLLIIAVFGQVLTHGFVNYDDTDYITENPKVSAGLSYESIIWAFKTRLHNHWHPMTWLSHMADYEIFGLNPLGHHLTSLLIHIANTLLLFLFLNLSTKAVWQSAFAAALFAIHPLHAETVCWIADRKDALSAFFWMITLLLYVRYTRNKSAFKFIPVVLGFVFGLMSKSIAVTIPIVLLLLDYWPLNRFMEQKSKDKKTRAQLISGIISSPNFGLIREKWIIFFLLAVSAILTLFAMRYDIASLNIIFKLVPSSVHISNALVSYVEYIIKMFRPINLSIVYPYFTNIPAWQTAGSAVLLIALTVFSYLKRKQYAYIWTGWLWYMITLLPAAGLVKVGPHSPADRYTYIPLIGLFIIIAWGTPDLLSKLRYKNRVIAISATIVLVVFSSLSFFQTGYWKNSETIFRHAIAVNDFNWIAHNNLGNEIARNGKMDEAVFHYKKSLRINSDNAKAHNNIGAVLIRLGKLDEAIEHLNKSVKLKPRFYLAYFNLGDALARKKEYEKAAENFEKAFKLDKDYAEAYLNFGVMMDRLGKPDEALDYFIKALEIQPDYYDAHHNMGVILAAHGNTQAAIQHFSEALRIKPDKEDTKLLLAEAYLKLGDTDMNRGELKEAAASYNEAIRIMPGFAGAHNNLGVALARQGKIEEAVEHFKEALRIDPKFEGAKKNLERGLKKLEKKN